MNIQKKLLKVRPPRVRITYQVDSENGLEKKELPFVIAVIADLQGNKKRQNSHHHYKFVELNQDNFSSVMQSIKPELSIKVRNYLTFDSQEKARGQNDKLILKLNFVSMESFRPDAIVELPEFAEILQDRRHLVDLISKIDSDQYLKEELIELLNQNLAGGNQYKAESEGSDKRKEAVQTESKEKSANEKSASRSKKDKSRLSKEEAIRLSREYFGSEDKIEMLMVLQRLQGEIRDLHGAIMQAIAEIDSALSAQIDEILHHQ